MSRLWLRQPGKEAENVDNQVSWRLGKTLDGRYEMISVLGIGGMAVVYKAFDHKLKRHVAIKVLRDDVAMDSQSRRRFRTEYQAVGMLSHPNIRAVYDVVSSGDTEYIVMEYVEGINLKQYLKKKGALSWKETLHFSTQIAKALSHAHSKGIIHMDIKPQNIMLPRDGTAKVADFGIAQLGDTGEDPDDSEEAVGSIHYISPEQARGEAVDARSDIYSLGVVMYEMLTGKLPFDGDSVAEVAVKHFTVVPEAPTAINPEIPPELEEITLHAMQPDPNERYRSIDEMLSDLEDFRKGQTASITQVVRQALAEQTPETRPALRDEIHIITKNVPRISTAGELSKQGYLRRRSRAKRISMLLGISLVVLFALGLFAFVWKYLLQEIFSDAERISVPSFIGQTEETILNDQSMTDLYDFTVTYKADSVHPAGEIIGQNPSVGASRMVIPEGIKVELTVSSGIKLIQLPDVSNMSSTDAQISLQSIGLNVEMKLEASETVTKNYVIGTEPAAESAVSSGSTVTMIVSAGPTVTKNKVPNVVGLSKAEAMMQLQQKGFVCSESEITYVSSDPDEEGKVLWQSYTEGAEEITGTKVYLQIGSGSAMGPGQG